MTKIRKGSTYEKVFADFHRSIPANSCPHTKCLGPGCPFMKEEAACSIIQMVKNDHRAPKTQLNVFRQKHGQKSKKDNKRDPSDYLLSSEEIGGSLRESIGELQLRETLGSRSDADAFILRPVVY